MLMLSAHGTGDDGAEIEHAVCITAPLSGTTGSCPAPGVSAPINTSRYFHDDVGIDSKDSLTRILLCPQSCSTVQADAQAKVEVLFPCQLDIG
jgi:hypothetical protein